MSKILQHLAKPMSLGVKETKTFIVNGTEWPVDILYPNVTDHSGLEIKYIDSYYNRKWARESANKKLRMTYWKGPIGPIYNKLVAVSNSNPCPPGWEIPSQSDYMKLLQTFEHFPDLRKVIFNDEKIGSFLNGGGSQSSLLDEGRLFVLQCEEDVLYWQFIRCRLHKMHPKESDQEEK